MVLRVQLDEPILGGGINDRPQSKIRLEISQTAVEIPEAVGPSPENWRGAHRRRGGAGAFLYSSAFIRRAVTAPHSHRSARMGSIPAARRAGTYPAIPATAAMPKAAKAMVSRSVE